MILVTTELSDAVKRLKELPASKVAEMVLSASSLLFTRKSIYGDVVNVVYVYGDFNNVRNLKLNKHKGEVVFVCDVTLIYSFAAFLRKSGYEVSSEFPSLDDKFRFIRQRFGCENKWASVILEYYNYSLRRIVKNDDKVFDFLYNGVPLGSSVDASLLSYTHVLYYLCGDPDVTKQDYVSALAKYRFSNKHIVKFIRGMLSDYIELCMGGVVKGLTTAKQDYQIFSRLKAYLNLEHAMELYYRLDGLRCVDLLRVV